jgi:integrase
MAQSIPHRRRRRPGEGSAYPVAGGWRAAITVADPLTGQPRRRYLSGPTERAVLAKLDAARAGRDRGEAIGATPTLAAWAHRWLIAARLRVRASTWHNYQNALERHTLPRLGRRELAALRVVDVESLLAELVVSGLAPSTVGLVRTTLGACLNDAQRDGLISRNVARLARPPRVAIVERRALGPAELRRLFAATATDPLGPALVLLGTLGVRRGELLGLRWEDVDRGAATVTIRRQVARHGREYGYCEPKGARSTRTVGLPARALAALDALAGSGAWPTEGPIVATGGRPWHPVAFASAFRLAAERAGFAELRMHDLRHAAVSIALAAGVPPRDVAEAAGHSPAVLMRTYAHVMPGSAARVASAMDTALRDG